MKSFFKKCFGAIVATSLAISSFMCVGSVNVYAASDTASDALNAATFPTGASLTSNTSITANTEINTTYRLKTSDENVYNSAVNAGATNLSTNGMFSTTCQINSSGYVLKKDNNKYNVAQFKTPIDSSCELQITCSTTKKFYVFYNENADDYTPTNSSTPVVTNVIPKNTLVTIIGSSAGTTNMNTIRVSAPTPVLTLSGNNFSLKPNEKATVTVTKANIDADTTVVSSNTSVATCSISGDTITITGAAGAVADSTATITVTAGDLNQTITVTILDANTPETYTLTSEGISTSALTKDERHGTKNMFIIETGVKSSNDRIQVGSTAGVKFKAAANGTLVVSGVQSSNSSYDRVLSIKEDDTEIATVSAPKSTKNNSSEISLRKGSIYHIVTQGSGVNIDSIQVNGILEQMNIKGNLANAVKKMGVGDYYALDTTNNYVYIIHPVKSTDTNYSTSSKLYLYQSGTNEKLDETATVYNNIQFAADDTFSVDDLDDKTDVVGLYAVKEEEATTPTAPTATGYYWQLAE